jgi:bacitracin synthase 3
MIVGILGILKAGGAYVPIDPEYPEAMIRYMLEDSGSKILVTTSKLIEEDKKLRSLEVKRVLETIIIDSLVFSNFSTSHLLNFSTSPSSLAYIIYTSGTTGKPKGTLTKHFNVIRVVKNTNYIRLTGADRILQLSNFAFDGSVFDIYGALLNSAVLVMIEKDKALVLDRLAELISREQISLFFVTTALFNALVDLRIDCLANIKKVLFGGERVSVDHVKKALEYLGKDRIIHVYGPTETTVYATYYFINSIKEKLGTIPIGKPISNTCVYILDKSQKPLPIGIVGEIYISGDGVARGYLNRPELTAEKFCLRRPGALFEKTAPVPWSIHKNFLLKGIGNHHLPSHYPIPPLPHSPIYRTGDLARWLPDGNIEFLGRIDYQVKVRGFRIECGEIEAVLANHPKVQEAVVIARTINNTMQLIAYCVNSDEDKVLEASELRSYLQGKLPEYMIPAAFVLLEAIPLTPNGKVDRKFLLEQEVELLSSQEYAAPRTEIEEQLARIWEEVLGAGRVGIHDNFFELGGHSLLATQIISRINKELEVEVPLSKLFELPRLKDLSKVIEESNPYQVIPICSIRRPAQLPLSYAQERLWFLAQLGYSEQYHIPDVMKIKGDLDEEALQKTMNFMVARHESLRTGFKKVDGKAIQVIEAASVITIEKRDLGGLSKKEQERECQTIILEFIQRPFQLKKAPLIRVMLIKTDAAVHILGICLHHIISDGWSMGILTREITRAYAAYREGKVPEPGALKHQYADYAVWQREVMTEAKLDKELKYWKEHLAGYEDLDLPTDFPRPKQVSGKGGHVRFRLPGEEAKQLKKRCQENQVTLFTLLMAGIYLLLRRYSQQEDICMGMPTANRNLREIEDLVGFFVNTLVIRIDPGENRGITVRQLLKKVQEEIVAAQDRQNVPFEKVVESIQPTRDLSRTPIFQVLVNYVNINREKLQLGESQLEGVDFEYGSSKFDLMFAFSDQEDGALGITVEYSRDLYREDTTARMGEHLVKIMTGLAEGPGKAVDDIQLLTAEEKKKLLIEWNDTTAGYPGNKCLNELFREQIKKTPEQAAVVFEDQMLTYRELDETSTGLAMVLQKKGITSDSLVGVCLERSLETITGILAILKAGGTYMPIDPGYPGARLKYMLEDSHVKVLLLDIGTKQCSVPISRWEGEIIFISSFLPLFPPSTLPPFLPSSPSSPANLAYVIYTSGSTGKLKGVMQTHQTITNLTEFQKRSN